MINERNLGINNLTYTELTTLDFQSGMRTHLDGKQCKIVTSHGAHVPPPALQPIGDLGSYNWIFKSKKQDYPIVNLDFASNKVSVEFLEEGNIIRLEFKIYNQGQLEGQCKLFDNYLRRQIEKTFGFSSNDWFDLSRYYSSHR
ncbi:MAG: hypothetical protein HQK53_17125 [Oligoflexia bacterium]|nr:hypothetical protein [Oligoflexia bacterium]